MIRYTFFVLTVLGSAATAIAAIAPASDMPLAERQECHGY